VPPPLKLPVAVSVEAQSKGSTDNCEAVFRGAVTVR